MSQVLQSDCQCFGSLFFSLYGQGALLGTRSPVLMEIIALGCQKFAFIGGRFMSCTSSPPNLDLDCPQSSLYHHCRGLIKELLFISGHEAEPDAPHVQEKQP